MKVTAFKFLSLMAIIGGISWSLFHIEPKHQEVYEITKDNLSELNLLEARLEKDFLKTQISLTDINYDQINFHIHNIRSKKEKLLEICNKFKQESQYEHFIELVDNYLRIASQREKKLETLKSETAVLSNSLHYLRNDYVLLLSTSKLDKNSIQLLNQLFNDLVLYNLNPSNSPLKNKILSTIEVLSSGQSNDSLVQSNDFIQKIIKHASIVIENTTLLRNIVRELNQLDTKIALQLIEKENKKILETDLFISNKYQMLLGSTTFLLLASVVFFIRRNEKSNFMLAESLRELERQKYALDEHAIVSIADKKGHILYANDNFISISGYSQDELAGKDHRLLNSAYHDKSFFSDMWKTISSGKVWSNSICNQAKDGSIYWVQSTIVPFLDANNNVDHYISIRTDITKQKEMEQAAVKSEERQRTILNNLADGIYLVDLKGHATYFNSTAEQMLGWKLDEVNNQCLHDIIHHHRVDGSLLPFEECPISLSMQKGKVFKSDEEIFFHKNGKDFPVSISCAPLYESQKMVGSVVCFRDISEQQATKLELIRAKETAEDATRAKSMFLANMSHEIRTPMNAIIGMAYLALKTDLNPRQRDYISQVHKSAKALLGIINDILDFSKVEAGKMELDKTAFVLEDVISNTLSVLRQPASEKEIELLLHISDPLLLGRNALLIGDPLRLSQILTNLLSNSIKFTHQGYVKLSVECDERNSEYLGLIFKVCDTGIGMSPEQVSRLFQEFTQVDGTTTRKYGGTGLGLSITKKFIELMNGSIEVSSTKEVGSIFTFKVEFPFAKSSDEISPTAISSVENLRILIVDDQSEARRVLFDLLASLGVSSNLNAGIKCVSSAQEAIDELKLTQVDENGYNFVLLDWVMPQIDGQQFLEIFNSILFTKRPEIVVISAYDSDAIRDAFEAFYVKHFLTKPVLPDSLRNLFMLLTGQQLPEIENEIVDHSHYDLSGMNVLLVEDNTINQQLALELMNRRGINVTLANNGEEALKYLKLDKDKAADFYDVVLMDLQMPVMDGYEATRRIRSDARYIDLPIIAMTAHALVEEQERCRSIGMNGHISKPIDPDDFYQHLAHYRPITNKIAPPSVSSKEKSYEISADLLSIEGLNALEGVKRTGSTDCMLYRKMLKTFLTDFENYENILKNNLIENQWVEAERLTHTLKGLSGTLGIKNAPKVIAELENGFVNKDINSIKKSWIKTREVLKPIFIQLQTVFEKNQTVENELAVEKSVELPSCVPIILKLLHDCDTDVSSLWEENRTELSRSISSYLFQKIEVAIHNFEFDSAYQLLNSLSDTGD